LAIAAISEAPKDICSELTVLSSVAMAQNSAQPSSVVRHATPESGMRMMSVR
jgi:hypothetical protein